MPDKHDIQNRKKQITIITIALVSLLLGIILGYYFNPRCGEFKERTQYVFSTFKRIFETHDTTTITQVPIECNCPDCNQDLENKTEKDLCPIKVDVSGALKNPGVYCLNTGSVIMDAVNKAGGFDPAYGYKYISRKINLAYELRDNQKIYFPYKEDLLCSIQSFSPEIEKEIVISEKTEGIVDEDTVTDTNSETINIETKDDCISINNGTKDELMKLTGVGEATAQKIIDGRPYAALEDLLNVKGIGNATFEKIKNDICL